MILPTRYNSLDELRDFCIDLRAYFVRGFKKIIEDGDYVSESPYYRISANLEGIQVFTLDWKFLFSTEFERTRTGITLEKVRITHESRQTHNLIPVYFFRLEVDLTHHTVFIEQRDGDPPRVWFDMLGVDTNFNPLFWGVYDSACSHDKKWLLSHVLPYENEKA